jgi:hypothetical protein
VYVNVTISLLFRGDQGVGFHKSAHILLRDASSFPPNPAPLMLATMFLFGRLGPVYPGSPPAIFSVPTRCAVEGSHVKVRIVRVPPANDGTALEIDMRSLRVGRVYDLSASAASYLVVMGFAEVELPLFDHPSAPAPVQQRKARARR